MTFLLCFRVEVNEDEQTMLHFNRWCFAQYYIVADSLFGRKKIISLTQLFSMSKRKIAIDYPVVSVKTNWIISINWQNEWDDVGWLTDTKGWKFTSSSSFFFSFDFFGLHWRHASIFQFMKTSSLFMNHNIDAIIPTEIYGNLFFLHLRELKMEHDKQE